MPDYGRYGVMVNESDYHPIDKQKKEGEFERLHLKKARVQLHFLIKFVYCLVHFSFVSMTTPRYLAESVSEIGVS